MRNLCLRVLHKQAVGRRVGCSPVLQKAHKAWKREQQTGTAMKMTHFMPQRTPVAHCNCSSCASPELQWPTSAEIQTSTYVEGKKATGRKARWFELEVQELYKFLELLIYALVSPSSLVNYWKRNQSVPFPASLMTRDRFWMIFFWNRFPSDQEGKDNDAKRGATQQAAQAKEIPIITPKRIWQ